MSWMKQRGRVEERLWMVVNCRRQPGVSHTPAPRSDHASYETGVSTAEPELSRRGFIADRDLHGVPDVRSSAGRAARHHPQVSAPDGYWTWLVACTRSLHHRVWRRRIGLR